MKIGILSLQGDFQAHANVLSLMGHTPVLVKRPEQLAKISGLILPGGESTTNLRLMALAGLMKEIIRFFEQGIPIFGTCAGIILMAREVISQSQFSFGFLPIEIQRNAYGSQKDSFVEDLWIAALDRNFPCVFIRAPKISQVSKEVEILGKQEDTPLLVRHRTCLGATFHPELTEDPGVHRIFLDMCKEFKQYEL